MALKRKIEITAMLLVISFLGICSTVNAKPDDRKIVTTKNGAKLICYSDEGIDYEVIGIKKAKKDIIIPETTDGHHKIVGLNLLKEVDEYINTVKHIHLSKNIKNIHTGSKDDNYESGIFYWLPNLRSVTIDSENLHFCEKNGKIYRKKDNVILAVVPKLAGELHIEGNVKKIAPYALYGLQKVTAFKVERSNPKYKTKGGIIYSKDGKTLLQYPLGKKSKKFNIPKGVVTIGESAFERAYNLKKVKMPTSLRKIGVAAFYDSGLTKVSLNKKILEIKEYAFDETEIESIKFPSGLRKVEIGTIPVEKLTIPETLGEISVENDDYDTGEGSLNVDTLVIKNPALDLFPIENNIIDDEASIFNNITVYVYKGSKPYNQLKKFAKISGSNVKIKLLKGKVFHTPPNTGEVDVSWYKKEKKRFYISTPAQLAGFSKLSKKHNFKGKEIILKKNLNMKEYKNFEPIKKFAGIFNGRGKKIRNLKIYRLTGNIGLFSKVSGQIKNLKVSGNVTGGNHTGGIVGKTTSTKAVVKNCFFTGKVKGYGYSGKLIGWRKRR